MTPVPWYRFWFRFHVLCRSFEGSSLGRMPDQGSMTLALTRGWWER